MLLHKNLSTVMTFWQDIMARTIMPLNNTSTNKNNTINLNSSFKNNNFNNYKSTNNVSCIIEPLMETPDKMYKGFSCIV